MSVLTEAMLRIELKNEDLDELREYSVDKGVIVTPSAKAFLSDHKIDLIVGDKKIIKTPKSNPGAVKTMQKPISNPSADNNDKSVLPEFTKPAKYTALGGGQFAEKPEHMTALRGTNLVNKDHKLIILRGQLDSFCAKIAEAQFRINALGMSKLVSDLDGVLAYVQEILGCEVKNAPVPEMKLMGMDEAEIRSHSHTPKKYYGINHFAASYLDGEAVVFLNLLRTQVREIEICAYKAFKDEYGIPSRSDIMQALNRLSSVFYVMMIKVKAKEYDS